ncbi:MAG: transporter substrate-binding domain-containing protein [Christensenellales bacterium]|jgi:polar amino acid transport system substrate-binding protein
MKKLVSIAIALMLLVSATGAFAQTFTVGFDPNYPPYSYMGDDGAYTGFDIEMAKAVCEVLGWEYAEYAVNWDTKDLELNAGACDCVWSGFTINGREDDYAWSFPYVDNSQVILTYPDSGIQTADDLAGKIIGVQIATSAQELLEDEEGLKPLADTFGSIQVVDSYVTAAAELKAGSVDALVIDIGVAKFYVESDPDNYVIGDAIASEEYGVGFRIGEEDLVAEVEGAIMQLVADGTYQTLAEKYGLEDFICLTIDE